MLPEDATSQTTNWTDCSAFIYNIFRTATGFRISDLFGASNTEAMMNYAEANQDNESVVVMFHRNSAGDNERKILADFQSRLRAGDIVVYRQQRTGTEAGHVMMYVGNNRLIHATGNSFWFNSVQENLEEDGTVQYLSLNALLIENYDPTTNEDGDGDISTGEDGEDESGGLPPLPIDPRDRYLFSDEHINFAIIRPMNDGRAINANAQTEIRRSLDGIKIEKVSSVDPRVTIPTGSELEYTIKLTNTSNQAFNNIQVTDIIPSGTAYVSSNGIENAGQLSWTVNIAPKDTVTLTYSVSVVATSGTIVSSSTKVNDLEINKITNYVGATLSEAQQQAVSETAYRYAAVLTGSNFASSGTGNNYRQPPETIAGYTIGQAGLPRAIYYNLFGTDIRYTYTSNAFDALVNYDNWLFQTNTSSFSSDIALFRQMIVPNMYGGRELTTFSESNIVQARADRAREVTVKNLVPGDIITYRYSSTYQTSVYIFVRDAADTPVLMRFGSAGITTHGGDECERWLNNLLAKKQWVVLRPSLAFSL